jgi:hypothetical protein
MRASSELHSGTEPAALPALAHRAASCSRSRFAWTMQKPAPGRSDARPSSISKVWVSTIETLVHAAFRWSPAATPADRCAPLVTESCGRSGARCWRSEALGGAAEPLRQRLRVGRGFGIPDDLALSRAGGSRRRASPDVAVVVAWRGVCCDAVMPGRRATSGPSPRPGRGADRTGRGPSVPWRAAGCRSSCRRS